MLLVLCLAGLVYTVASGFYIRRFFRDTLLYRPSGAVDGDGASILKPLHGAEPGLRQHLESFLSLDKSGPTQVVFGVQSADDPALPIVETLRAEHGDEAVVILSNPRQHGQNRKISNVLNMMAVAEHPIIVLSDSDIGVRPDYLERVRAALSQPGVGVVTCPYYGEGRAGFWSGLAAMGLSYQFLPNVITGVSLRLAAPCMGSTIAIRRETLSRIGGFEAFQDVLADDYAIGRAVRRLGLKSVVAPILVSHGSVETQFSDVFAHELRWAKTVRGVDAAGHMGSVVTHPLPLAVLVVLFQDLSAASMALVLAAFIARVWLMSIVDRVIGRRLGPWWLLPIRDMLSFFVFVGSFFVRSVEWRGMKFHVSGDGDLKPV